MAADDLAELRGLEAPPMDAGAALAEGSAALALGLLAAWGIAAGARALTARAPSPEGRALDRLAALEGDASEEGLAARAALLDDLARALPGGEGSRLARLDAHLGGLFAEGPGAGLRAALYRPGAPFDAGAFDAALRGALRRAGR